VAPPAPPPDAAACDGVADLHVDLPYQVHYRGRSRDLGDAGADVTARSLRDGGVRLIVLSVYLSSGLRPRQHTIDEFDDLLATCEAIVSANPDVFAADPRIEVVYGVEGAGALAGHEDRLPELVRRGVKVYGLVHNHHNALADSSQDRHRARGGLTPAGDTFVRAVYAAGGIVDVSHASDDAARDVVEIARAVDRPVIATHSDARALADHPRNLPDDLLRAIASTGGIVGVNFHAPFLRRRGRATIDDAVAHTRHMIDVMGADHVAIGSDFDGNIRPARGLASHADIPALAERLRAADVADDDVRAVLGGNAARVLLGNRCR